MEDLELRKLVSDTGMELVEKKLVARTWGNISARKDATHFAISPSGLAYDLMTPEDVPVYLLYGNPILEPYLSLDENLKAQVDQAVANGADIKDVEASYYKEERDFFKDWKNLTMKEIPGPVRVSVYAPKEIGVELKSFVKNCMSKQN